MLDLSVLQQLHPVQPPPNPLDSMAKVVALKNAMVQGQDLQAQVAQRQQEAQMQTLQNQKAVQAAQLIHDHIGKGGSLEDEDLINQLGGIDPQLGISLRTSNENIKKSRAETDKARADTAKLNQDVEIGPTADVAPGTTRVSLKNGKPLFSAPLSDVQKADIKEKEASARKANAEATVKELESGTYPQTVDAFQAKLDALAPPTDKTLADTNKRFSAMGKAGAYTPAIGADILKQAAKEAESISVAKNTVPFKVEVQQAGAGNLPPDAMDLAAQTYINSGQLPGRNPIMATKIMTRAAQILREHGMTAQAALAERNAAQANKEALGKLTTQNAQVEAFSQTAQKNMAMLQSAVNAIGDAGSPLLNQPLRAISGRAAGDPKISAFYAALLPAQSDIAKILNSSNATGVLDDRAMSDMKKALGADATPAMIKSALDIFYKDMANRKESYAAQLQDLQQKSVVGGGKDTAGATGKINVTAPDGSVHPFDTQAQADAFKKLAGIQ